MKESFTSKGGYRVVVLSPDAAADGRQLASLERAGIRCVRVATGYEAAAELLAAPAVALVIDLRLMGPRHLRLLQIARELDVEMLAVGAVPPSMTPEDLSGVRLISRQHLAEQLLRLVASAAACETTAPEDSGHIAQRGDRSPKAATPAEPAEQQETPELDPAGDALPDDEEPSSDHCDTDEAPGEYYAADEQPDTPPRDEQPGVDWDASAAPAPQVRRGDNDSTSSYEPQPHNAAGNAAGSDGTGDGLSPRLLLTPEELAALLGRQP